MDNVIQAVLDGASVSYCPSSYLRHSDEDALQVDGVPGENHAGIDGRAFIYLNETDRLAALGAALCAKPVGEVVDSIDTRALLDIAHALNTDEGWALYRAAIAEVFPAR